MRQPWPPAERREREYGDGGESEENEEPATFVTRAATDRIRERDDERKPNPREQIANLSRDALEEARDGKSAVARRTPKLKVH
jgi:hypothetical protein